MQISVILARKGSQVHTVTPSTTVEEAAGLLAEHRVGALVVRDFADEGAGLAGIVSERDLVREVARTGAAALLRTVADVMTADVQTCTSATTVDELMGTMSGRRIRHVPVVDDGVLVGIVSIGDVVKSRLDELETQTEAMEAYVTRSGA